MVIGTVAQLGRTLALHQHPVIIKVDDIFCWREIGLAGEDAPTESEFLGRFEGVVVVSTSHLMHLFSSITKA